MFVIATESVGYSSPCVPHGVRVVNEKLPVQANVGGPRTKTKAKIVRSRARLARAPRSERSRNEPGRMRWITTFSISYHSLQLTATIGKEPSEEQREALMEGLQTRSGDGFELVCLVTLLPHTRHNDTAEP